MSTHARRYQVQHKTMTTSIMRCLLSKRSSTSYSTSDSIIEPYVATVSSTRTAKRSRPCWGSRPCTPNPPRIGCSRRGWPFLRPQRSWCQCRRTRCTKRGWMAHPDQASSTMLEHHSEATACALGAGPPPPRPYGPVPTGSEKDGRRDCGCRLRLPGSLLPRTTTTTGPGRM
jgi:hypothetical protein